MGAFRARRRCGGKEPAAAKGEGEDESQAQKESPAEAGLGLPTRDAPPGGLKGRATCHYHIVSNGKSPAGVR